MASLTELRPDGTPFAGDASMWVANVAASEHALSVRGWVDWGNDLFVRLSVFGTDPISARPAKTGRKRRLVRSENSAKALGHPAVEMSAAQRQTIDSSSRNAVSFSSARTTKRFPSPRGGGFTNAPKATNPLLG